MVSSTDWVSCVDGACRFQGQGRNEGPDCARNVRGRVQFAGQDSVPLIVTNQAGQPAEATFAWRTEPNLEVQAETSFTYVTENRVSAALMAAAIRYTAVPLSADVFGC